MRILKIKCFAMPLIFLVLVVLAITCGGFVPCGLKSLFYTISLIIKDCLIFSLPFLIFSLIYNSVSKLGDGALKFIMIIVPLVCCSNFVNTLISYATSLVFIGSETISAVKTDADALILTPMFQMNLPKLISNDFALLSGILCGLVAGFAKNKNLNGINLFFSRFQSYFFRILTPIMPFFILGTTLKLQHEGMLATICSNYLSILSIFALSAYGWVLLQFALLSSFKIDNLTEYIRNITPAVITGFGSMSSSAALPLSVKAAEGNCFDKNNAAVIVPVTVNVHLVGDCFFIPLTAIAVAISFGHGFPSFSSYLLFAFYFVLAKFAVAAVPGGGILVMLPVLQTYLGFNADMLGLITAIYVLFDSFITACNVAGNGAMAMIFDRITYRIGWKKVVAEKSDEDILK
ncbi:MAG: dicarboxylate/amino acid:cation symporter [Holosporaceae bacterium]|nr:dicarboxylate/amino acid:cation symporter [Holosporaceae bacterium]